MEKLRHLCDDNSTLELGDMASKKGKFDIHVKHKIDEVNTTSYLALPPPEPEERFLQSQSEPNGEVIT